LKRECNYSGSQKIITVPSLLLSTAGQEHARVCMHALYSNLLKNPAQLLCTAQARRQGLAAGGPKTRRGATF